MGVAVGIAASVAATDWRSYSLGLEVAFREQDADRNRNKPKISEMRFIIVFYPIPDDVCHIDEFLCVIYI